MSALRKCHSSQVHASGFPVGNSACARHSTGVGQCKSKICFCLVARHKTPFLPPHRLGFCPCQKEHTSLVLACYWSRSMSPCFYSGNAEPIRAKPLRFCSLEVRSTFPNMGSAVCWSQVHKGCACCPASNDGIQQHMRSGRGVLVLMLCACSWLRPLAHTAKPVASIASSFSDTPAPVYELGALFSLLVQSLCERAS